MFIYPFKFDNKTDYPTRSNFSIKKKDGDMGFGIYSKKAFNRGSMVARFTGNITNQVVQHSLQINPTSHIHDPYFAGLLLHSCSPNVALDMQDFTIWAIKDIEPGDALTMDYASTEDTLFRQFKCLCESDNCRHWITGRKEHVNTEGEQYLKSIEEENFLRIRKTG